MTRLTIAGPLLVARFVERPNRFILIAEPEGPLDDAVPLPKVRTKTVRAHLPNPGRMPEFRRSNTRWVLKHTPGKDRRTQWRAVMAKDRGRYAILDTQLANPLVAEGLRAEAFPHLRGWTWRAEARHGDHRFDFRLEREDEAMLLEVKSVNLVPDRTARFPDAPTVRGASHLRHLASFARSGEGRAGVLFIVSRDDVDRVVPNVETDPDFRDALEDARDAGVNVHAWTTHLAGRTWSLKREVPVRL